MATISPVVTPVPSGLTYCDDTLPTDMAANFRNYMTHLSHLSPDHDNNQAPLFEQRNGVTQILPGKELWPDSKETFSSGSDSDDCEMACDFPQTRSQPLQVTSQPEQHSNRHGDEQGCEVHSRSHGRRNPHFPYESFGTPRLAWGETPREAWSDHHDDHLYDSMNPYSLFNLPKSSQRGKRKQKRQVCTCQSRNSERNRDTVAREPAPISRIVENRRTSAKPTDLYNHNTCNQMTRLSGCDHQMDTFDPANRYSGSNTTSPQPSTSSGVIDHTAKSRRMLNTSKSLPIFSSQESMDTNSETGESSDTDVDIVSVNHAAPTAPCLGCDVNRDCSNCGTREICPLHRHSSSCGHSAQVTRVHESSGVIRPKAIKLESGQKYHTCDPLASCDARMPSSCNDRASSSIYKKQSVGSKTCIRKASDSGAFPSSESRVLQMASAEGVTESSPHNVICENPSCATQKSPTNRKSLKDLHNTVIRERMCKHTPAALRSTELQRNTDMEAEQSIDLTIVDSDENSSTPVNGIDGSGETRAAVSPVISEVNFPSASDDSDIEVVKIETSR